MVILSTVVPQGNDYLIGFEGEGSAYLWDLRRIVNREYGSQHVFGTSTYAYANKIKMQDTIFKSKSVGESAMLLCTYGNLLAVNSQQLVSACLDKKNVGMAPFDKLMFRVPSDVVQEHPHEKHLFSSFFEKDGIAALGFSSGAIGIYDLEQRQLTMRISGHASTGTESRSRKHMICDITQPAEQLLVAGSACGELFEIDIRVGKKTRDYSHSGSEGSDDKLSPVVSLATVGKHIYACHESYISKWNYNLARCSGIIDPGFSLSAMMSSSKGLLFGGNIPYLYSLNDTDLSHKKWDVSPNCIFAIGEFEGLLTVGGTGPLLDVVNNLDRVCSLATFCDS